MKNQHRFFALVLTLLLGVSVLAGVVFAESPRLISVESASRVIRVGFYEATGISTITQAGKRTGQLIDHLNEIAKYTSWSYEFVDGTLEEMIAYLQQGKVDIIGGVNYNKFYSAQFSYPNYPMGYSDAVLFARKEDTTLRSYNITSLNGKTIGVYAQATDKIARLKRFLTYNDLTCTIKEYTAEERIDGNLYAYLERNDVDLLLGNNTETNPLFRVVAQFEGQPYYIVSAASNSEITAKLNDALAHIYDANPNFIAEIRDKNFPPYATDGVLLTEDEESYIKQNPTVRVAVLHKWHPLFCMEDDAESHKGIVADTLSEMSRNTGLKFEYVYADTYQQAIESVQNGEADMLGCFFNSEEDAVSRGLARTVAFASLGNVIIKNKSVKYPAPHLVAAVTRGRELAPSITASAVREYANVEECLTAVNAGKADFLFGLSANVESALQNTKYKANIAMVSLGGNIDACFALPRPVSGMLLGILNKSIGAISEEKLSNIEKNNSVSAAYGSSSLEALIYSNPLVFIMCAASILLLIVLVVLAYARARIKNALMESTLQKAQAASNAKSEFLSRMSHEIRTPMNAIVGLADLAQRSANLPPTSMDYLVKIKLSSNYLLSLINDILDMARIENDKMTLSSQRFSLSRIVNELDSMFTMQVQEKNLHRSVKNNLQHDWLMGDAVRLKQVLANLMSNAVKFTPKNGEVSLVITETAYSEQGVTVHFLVKDSGVGIAPDEQKHIFDAFEQAGTSASKSAGTGLGLSISRAIVSLMGGNIELKSVQGSGSEFTFTLLFAESKTEDLPASDSSLYEAEDSLQNMRILLAEDNDLNAEIAGELLEMRGAAVERACNGEDAVQMFEASKKDYYQIILMDIQMPLLNGIEATKIIRAGAHPHAKTIPIIAMTANTFQSDVDMTIEAGMNDFVAKPMDVERLYNVIQKAVDAQSKTNNN